MDWWTVQRCLCFIEEVHLLVPTNPNLGKYGVIFSLMSIYMELLGTMSHWTDHPDHPHFQTWPSKFKPISAIQPYVAMLSEVQFSSATWISEAPHLSLAHLLELQTSAITVCFGRRLISPKNISRVKIPKHTYICYAKEWVVLYMIRFLSFHILKPVGLL